MKYIPYRDNREFTNVIIGDSTYDKQCIDIKFYKANNGDDSTLIKPTDEAYTLSLRVNARAYRDTEYVSEMLRRCANKLGSIKITNSKQQTSLGTTYETVEIIAGANEPYEHVTIYAFYARLIKPGDPVDTLDHDDTPHKKLVGTNQTKQVKEVEEASKPYVWVTTNNPVDNLSSVVTHVLTSYRLYGTKHDNVEFTLHVSNPHTREHRSISFVINKNEDNILDKQRASFDECVCRISTLLTVNTLNRSVVDSLSIDNFGAFVIAFEDGGRIDINGAKECRVVDGWNNY